MQVNQDREHFERACGFLSQWVLSPEQALQNQSPRLVFSHVPKTGGTTLESILAKNFRLSDVMHLNAPEFKQYPKILSLKKSPPRFMCGHHPLHSPLYRHLPPEPIFHLTMLREPVARVVSYYNYLRGKTDHPLHQQAKTQSIEAFVVSMPSPEVNNGQARRFSGYLHTSPTDDESLFEMARQSISSCFSLVGTTACFDETMLLLNQLLGLEDIFYLRRNKSSLTITVEELKPAERQLIEHHNQADAHLYRHVEFELKKLINLYLESDEILNFKTSNQKYAELVSHRV